MANIKISQLPNLSQLANTTQFPVANANVTYAVTSANIQSYMATYPGGTFTGAVFSATGNVTSAGNVQAGNIRTTGLISATGNIISGNISTSRAVITTANITTGNISAISGFSTLTGEQGNITRATITDMSSSNIRVTGGTITGITDLAVADGGTGSSTLAANNVLLGNGASPLQTVAPGPLGNILASDGSTWVSAQNDGLTTAQTWQNLTGQRGAGVTYTNTTGRAIWVIVQVGAQTNGIQVYINSELVIRHWYDVNGGAGQVGYSTGEFIVPPGGTYLATAGPLRGWWEYR